MNGTRRRNRELARGRSYDSMRQALNQPVDAQAEAGFGATSMGTARRIALVSCLLVGFLFSLMDTTIVSTSLLAISTDLDGFRDSQWVVLAYLLTYLGFSMVLAKMSDIFGRYALLLFSWAFFAGFSIGCGCAVTMTQLIVCRAFQGIGGAGLYSLTTIALPEIGPAENPTVIGGIIGFTLSISFVLGPILGGVIPQYSSWRWLFLLNIPCGFVTTLFIILLYPRDSAAHFPWKTAVARIDYVGSILLLGATTLLIFSLQQAGSQSLAWSSWPVILTLVMAGLSGTAFFGWQWWLTTSSASMEPIFPIRLAKNRVYLGCLVATFFIGWVYLVIVLALPERFQIVNGSRVDQAGYHLLPLLGSIAVGSLVAGPINAKKNRTSILMVASCVLILPGTALFGLLAKADSPIASQYGFQAILGVGVGLFLSAATMMSQAQAPGGDHAVAQGAIAQARVLGGAIGLACSTIIFNSRLQTMSDALSPSELDALSRSPLAAFSMSPDLLDPLRRTYAAAFATIARGATGMAAVALAASLFTLERDPPPIRRDDRVKEHLSPDLVGESDVEMETLDPASGRESQEVVPAEPILPAPAVTRAAAPAK